MDNSLFNSLQPLSAYLAELVLLIGTCLFLLFSVMLPSKNTLTAPLEGEVAAKQRVRGNNPSTTLSKIWILFTLVVTIGILVTQINAPQHIVLNGAFIDDHLARILKLSILFITLLLFIYSKSYLKPRELPYIEFYFLILLSCLGMMLLVSSYTLFMMFLSLELFAMPLYALIGLQRQQTANEASIKYFVLGAIASTFLLYGFSFIYGLTGSISVPMIAQYTQDSASASFLPLWLMGIAIVFTLSTLAFKLAAAPFHMWAPDVYTGAPSIVTLFLSTASKIAAVGLFFRLFIDALSHWSMYWEPLLIILAVTSIAVGSIAAIAQTQLKRLFAYSSISHIGFLLLGFVHPDASGCTAVIFYLLIYALTTAAAFGLISVLSAKQNSDIDLISNLAGLNQNHPWLAFLWLIVLFSLAGIPPAVGFFGKLLIFNHLFANHHIILACFALFFSVIGAFYYLRVIKVIYFDSPPTQTSLAIDPSFSVNIALSFNALLPLGLGLFPGLVLNWCQWVF